MNILRLSSKILLKEKTVDRLYHTPKSSVMHIARHEPGSRTQDLVISN